MMSRSRPRTVTSVLVAVLAATSLVSIGPVAAAAPTPYSTNLVKNPGAQAGSLGAVPSWTVDHNMASRKYGAAGMPSKAHGNSFGGGTRLFSAGAYDTTFDGCGSATQDIRIRGRNGAIDAGNVRITLQGRLGTANTSGEARVTVQFRDGNNHQVISNQLTLGPVTTNKALVSRSASRKVPRTTRNLVVKLQGDPQSQACDGLFDNISVRITPA